MNIKAQNQKQGSCCWSPRELGVLKSSKMLLIKFSAKSVYGRAVGGKITASTGVDSLCMSLSRI